LGTAAALPTYAKGAIGWLIASSSEAVAEAAETPGRVSRRVAGIAQVVPAAMVAGGAANRAVTLAIPAAGVVPAEAISTLGAAAA
jgi:hypothetical protein